MRHPSFHGKVCDETSDAEYAGREMQEKEGWLDKDRWLHTELKGATGRILQLAFLSWMMVIQKSKQNSHIYQKRIPNCRNIPSGWEFLAL